MTLYLFFGIPAKYNLPVEKFHLYGVQSIKVKEGRSIFPMQQNLSINDVKKYVFNHCENGPWNGKLLKLGGFF